MRPVPPALEPRSIPVSKFRKYAGYVIMFVLMSMLIISFALWGIGDMLKLGGTSREVAHVGGTHIPLYGWIGGTSVSIDVVRSWTSSLRARMADGAQTAIAAMSPRDTHSARVTV